MLPLSFTETVPFTVRPPPLKRILPPEHFKLDPPPFRSRRPVVTEISRAVIA
jgi:hypothetical protein